GGVFIKKSFLDLGVHVVDALVDKYSIDTSKLDELIFGTVLLDPRTPNAARELVLRSKLPNTLSAHFISNNCISGLVASTMLAEGIQSGRIQRGIAGGSESMSKPTLTLSRSGEAFFLKLARARSLGERLGILSSFRPKMLFPQPPSPKEPSTGKTMGQHCEITAQEFDIARAAQDELALASHKHGAAAQEAGYLAEEIAPLDGVDKDNIIRASTSLEKLSSLKPVFDRGPKGTLTAGNSSPLTDGASVVYLVSEEVARSEGLDILGYIEAVEYAAIDPNDGLLMAPGLALPALLHKKGLGISDIDIFEIHEAFAAQVLSNMEVWEKGWQKYPDLKPIGKFPVERINQCGGSIAIGHPFAATGGRLIMSVVNQLKRNNQRKGVISVCAAGAMGCAMLISRD
ncbi:MAG: acetyl-CoA C-acyltransferase, partial [Bdellovibrionales bacterium]|nr:acetyl-CoA C-acyltransferase [Bdellovibrionales bacterium]